MDVSERLKRNWDRLHVEEGNRSPSADDNSVRARLDRNRERYQRRKTEEEFQTRMNRYANRYASDLNASASSLSNPEYQSREDMDQNVVDALIRRQEQKTASSELYRLAHEVAQDDSAQAVSGLKNYLDDTDAVYKVALDTAKYQRKNWANVYGDFSGKEEYDAVREASTYQQKYGKMTDDELASVVSGMEKNKALSAGERAWLNSYIGGDDRQDAAYRVYEINQGKIADLDKQISALEEKLKSTDPSNGKVYIPSSDLILVPNVDHNVNPEFEELSKELENLRHQKSTLETQNTIYERNGLKQYQYGQLRKNEDYEANRDNRTVNPTVEDFDPYYAAKRADYEWIENPGITPDSSARQQLPDKPEIQDRLGFWETYKDDPSLLDTDQTSGKIESNNEAREDYNLIRDGWDRHWDLLTEDEIGTYYYLYNTRGREEAEKYLDDFQSVLNRRNIENADQYMEEHFEDMSTLEQIVGAAAGVMVNAALSPLAFTDSFVRTVKGEDVDPYSNAYSFQRSVAKMRELQSAAIEEWTGGKSFLGLKLSDVYGSLLSFADSRAMQAIYGKAATVFMGMSAASSRAAELYDQGASNDDLVMGSLLAGVAEAAFEYISLEKFADIWKNRTKKKGWKKKLLEWLMAAGAEGSEEVNTDLANLLTDAAIRKDQSDFMRKVYDYIDQGKSESEAFGLVWGEQGLEIWKSFAGGAISGGLGAGLALAVGDAENAYYNRIAQENIGAQVQERGNTQDMLNEALNSDDARIRKLAQDVVDAQNKGKDSRTNRKLGKLYQANEQKAIDALNEASDKGKQKKATRAAFEKAARDYFTEKGTPNVENAVKLFTAAAFDGLSTKQRGEFNGLGGEEVLSSLVNQANQEVGQQTREQKGKALASRAKNMLNLTVDRAGALEQTAKKAANFSRESVRMLETIIDGDNMVSSNGKTTLASTGERVEISRIASLDKAGKMTFSLSDGRTVDSSDIRYANRAQALIYESMRAVGYAPQTASNLAGIAQSTVRPDLPASRVVLGLQKAYEYGWGHVAEGSRQSEYFAALPQEARELAMEFGQEAREAYDAELREKQQKKAAAKAQEEQKKASVRFEGGVTEENAGEQVKAARDALALVAEKSGVSFVITDEISNRENGHYDPKTNTIYLSPDAGKSGQRTILWTASHELVHAVKEAGVDDFNLLADTLMEAYGKKGVNIDALVAIEQEKAARAGAELSFRDAYEEVVAQAMQDFLTDSEQGFFRTMQNLEAKKPGIGEILLEAIQKILQRIAGIYNGMKPTDAAYAYVGQMNEELGRMYEIMTRALTGEAAASQQSTKADTKKAASKEGGVKAQIREIVDVDGNSFGKGVYLDSTLLSGLSEAERKKMVTLYVKELGGTVFEARRADGTIVPVKIAEPDLKFMNDKGKKTYVNRDLSSKFTNRSVKQEAVALVDELVTTSSFNKEEKARHPHGWLDNDGKNRWERWTTYLQDKNNTVWEASLRIATAADGTKYLYDIDPINEIEKMRGPGIGRNSSANSLSTSSENVNTLSEKNSGKSQIREDAETDLAKDYAAPITAKDVEELRSIGRKSVSQFTSKDLQKAGKWAYKFYQELGTKSPFFRTWFGDWRANDLTKATVVKGTESEYAGAGKTTNKDMNRSVSWGDVLKKETQVHSRKTDTVKFLGDIGDIVENAVLFDTVVSEASSKTKMPNTAYMHSLYSVYKTNGETYLLKLYVEEALPNRGGDPFSRAYELKTIEKIANLPNGVLSVSEGLTDGKSAISNLTVADLFSLVKQFDKDFSSGSAANPMFLNDNGTPKMFYHGSRTGGFTEFRSWQYFSEKKNYAQGYADRNNENSLYAVYLHADKIFDTRDAEARRIFYDIRQEYGLGEVQEDTGLPDWTDGYDLSDYLEEHPELGYDAILLDEGGDMIDGKPVSRGESIVIKNSSQIKSATDNIGTFDRSNPDILHQYRDYTSINERRALVAALEASAQTDSEKMALTEYRRNLGYLEQQEQKLVQLRREIRELSFAKGKRDMAQIQSLREEAMLTSNRIDTADKALLRGEKMAPIKRLLQSETAKAALAEKQRAAAALREEKQAASKEQRELADRYRERMRKNVEGRKMTETKNKIKRAVSDLRSLMNAGKDRANVKIELRPAVQQALDTADVLFSNMSDAEVFRAGIHPVGEIEINAAKRYEEFLDRVERMQAELKELPKGSDAYREKAKNLETNRQSLQRNGKILQQAFIRERAALNALPVSSAIQALADAYKDLGESKSPHVAAAYDSTVYGKLLSIKTDLGGTTVQNMSLAQLESVYDAYKLIRKTVRDANRVWRKGKWEDVQTNGDAVVREVQEVRPQRDSRAAAVGRMNTIVLNELKPYYFFEAVGSPTLSRFYDSLRAGEDTFARDVYETQSFLADVFEQTKAKKWDMDKTFSITLEEGRTVQLSLGEMLSIYAYSKREQALKHMSEGGFMRPGTQVKTGDNIKGKVRDALLPSEDTGRKAFRVKEADVGKIVEALNKEDKNYIVYADRMQKFLSEVMGAKGNEASRALYAIDLFKEQYYFPLQSSKDFMASAATPPGESSLRNSGMTKETTPGAKNPIILQSFNDVWASHVNKMSLYHAFVLPIDAMNKLLNYTDFYQSGEPVSVKTALNASWGRGAYEYIHQLLVDLNGGVTVPGAKSPIGALIGRFKKTAVAANLSVMVQQPTAILRAMTVIDPSSFIPLTGLSHKAKWEQLKKYAPVAVLKEMGGFDVGSGRQLQQYLFGDSSLMAKIDDFTMKGAAFGDEIGWNMIWDAAKRQIHRETGLSYDSEDLLQQAGKLFTKAVHQTQVYDSVLSRSGYMRSQSDLVKMSTSFMAEPTTTVNMLYNAVLQLKRGKMSFQQASRTVAFTFLASIAAAVAQSFVTAARDKDEDKTYYEKLLGDLVGNTLSNTFIPGMLPVLRDVVSLLEGWDVERTDMALVNDLIAAVKTATSDKKSTYDKVEAISGAFANFFGIPLRNILRDGRAFYNVVRAFFSDTPTTGQGIKESIQSEIPFFGHDASNAESLYNAYVADDRVMRDRVIGRYKDEEAAQTALKSEIRRRYLKGQLDRETALRNLQEFVGENEDEAYWSLDRWDYAKAEGTAEGYDRYEDLHNVIPQGTGTKAVLQTYLDNGVSRQALAAEITRYFKPLYRDMSPTERSNIRGKLLNAYEALGYSRTKKLAEIISWGSEESDYADLFKTIQRGTGTKQALQEYLDKGTSKSTLADKITDYFKPKYQAMGETERSNIRGKLLNAYEALGYNRQKKLEEIVAWGKEKKE